MPKYSASAKSTLDEYMSRHPGGMMTLGSRQPDTPGTNSTLAGPSQGDAYDASQKLANDHGEAVRQMRKLAQSYSMSSMAIGATEAPTYPPMPTGLDAAEACSRTRGTDIRRRFRRRTGPQTSPLRCRSGCRSSLPAAAQRQVGTEIAGGVATPEAPTNPAGPANPAPTGPSGPANPAPVLGAPPVAPVTNPGMGRVGTGPGTFSGKAVPGNTMGRTPGVPGRPGGPGPRTIGRMPGDHGNGIYGGRPGTPANAQAPRGLARGNVIGAEGAQGQKGAQWQVGQGWGWGPVWALAVPTSRASSEAGRWLQGRAAWSETHSCVQEYRLDNPSHPGGVGSRRGASSSGANAAPEHGSSTGRGTAGGTQAARPGEPHDENGQRPDYLVEDEETWSQRNRGQCRRSSSEATERVRGIAWDARY